MELFIKIFLTYTFFILIATVLYSIYWNEIYDFNSKLEEITEKTIQVFWIVEIICTAILVIYLIWYIL